MKKMLYCAAALAVAFFAGSCQQEKLEPVQESNAVTFTVEAPAALQTRAIADGLNVNELVYEVWLTETLGDLTQKAQKLYQAKTDMSVENGVNKATITLDLVNDQKFTVLFWAQVKEEGAYDTEELTAVTYAKSEYNANNESLAAFYAVAYVDDCQHVKKDGSATGSQVTLYRPFAQLNLGTLNTSTAYTVALVSSEVNVKNVNTVFNVATSVASVPEEMTFKMAAVPSDPATLSVNGASYEYAGMNYMFAGDNVTVEYDIVTSLNSGMEGTVNNIVTNVPLKENYRTNIIGNLLTSKVDYEIVVDAEFNKPDVELGEIEGQTYTKVTNTAEFTDAFNNNDNDIIILGNDINLNDLTTRSTEANPTYVIVKGKTLTIDLNGFTLSSTSSQTGKNYNMLDVNGGTLTVKNGTISYEHKGENMLWNNSTNIFNVTNGGVLNLEGVTAKNLGGSDMGFVAHLNNWGEVTLNAENCTLESNYVAVRVFNSGNDMNNVTIKNSTLTGVSAAFWVHNYTSADFGSEAKAEAHKALLNLNIYNQGNTFSPDVNGIRYGFTNSVRADAYGITKTVSEDGTVVTLGSVTENGLVRRGVAGAEGNTTITKAIVGEGITTLYDRTFRRFYALESVELPSTLTTIGAAGTGVFQSCTNLKNVVIPESVTVLGKGTFQECSSLESINIPSGVTRIEENALRATGLVSVEFHEGVTYFGAQAFRDCKQLKEVVIKAPKFTIEANAFGSMAAPYPAVTIYVANTEMKEYLESTLTYANQLSIVVPGLVNDAEELKEALADNTKDIITLAAGVTYEGIFEVNRGVKIVSESADNKAIIKGRINVKGNAVTALSFTNVKFAVNADSKVVWTSGGAIMKQKPSIVMAEANNGKITFSYCDFDINGSAFAYTNSSNSYTIFDNCTFNGAFNYAMYVRANIEVTNCTYNTTVTNVLVGACVNNLANGKVVFMHNDLPTGANIGLAGAIVFCSTNNENGKWSGPVEFTVKDNTGFAYAYERMGDFIVDPDDHTFTDGSETFSF